eukprot:396142-Pelagomonas_calceolata.AAC.5
MHATSPWVRLLFVAGPVALAAHEPLPLAVLAGCYVGKSTLINALVGDELLPMNNVPETARICKVVHSERAHQPFMMEPASSLAQQQAKRQSHSDSGLGVEQAVITCRGGPAIRARLQELNRAMRSHDILSTSPSTSSQQLSPLPSFHDAQEPHAATDRPGLDAAGLEGAVSPNAVEGGGPVTVDRNMLAIVSVSLAAAVLFQAAVLALFPARDEVCFQCAHDPMHLTPDQAAWNVPPHQAVYNTQAGLIPGRKAAKAHQAEYTT